MTSHRADPVFVARPVVPKWVLIYASPTLITHKRWTTTAQKRAAATANRLPDANRQ